MPNLNTEKKWHPPKTAFPRIGQTAIFLLLIAITSFEGCQRVKPAIGGTPGNFVASSDLVGDIHVKIYQLDGDSLQPVGFAVTAADGSFQLLQNGAQGPLWLSPGEYRCTLESAGTPVKIPPVYAKPETTPLKVSWSKDDQSLNLSVPIPLAP
jgi:hypothetical protein